MEWFNEGLIVGVLVVEGILVLFGVLAAVRPSAAAHAGLKRVTTAVWIMIALQTVGAIVVLVWGQGPFSSVTAVGYVIVGVALLPLLGIARIAEPPAPGQKREPGAPVLSPRQLAKVDGLAAIIVGLALAIIAWRLGVVLAPVAG